MIKPFRDGWNWVADLFSAHGQNGRLRTQVEQLRQQLAQSLVTQQENDQLRTLLEDAQLATIFPKGRASRTRA